MTNPAASQRFIAGLAAAVAVARASLGHPQWHEAGIAAAIRKSAETMPLVDVGIAFLRAAAEPANDTPAAILNANNRAWDSDWYLPCKLHPETRARREGTGECAACYADRVAATEPLPLRRRGVPPSPEIRERLVAAFTTRPSSAGDGEGPVSGRTLDG